MSGVMSEIMSGETKTQVWNPYEGNPPRDRVSCETFRGVLPPLYEREYTPPAPPTVIAPAWTRYHSAPRENYKNSGLMRLPDTVLARIMTCVDKHSLLRLRHTSRTFMRLFSECNNFAGLWLHNDPSRVWMAPNCTYPEQDKPSYCSSCVQVRGDVGAHALVKSMKQLWCSGCLQHHTEMHFSFLQRAQGDRARICIGREGMVKFCSHGSLTWNHLKSMASISDGPIRSSGITCDCHDVEGVDCRHVRCKYTRGSSVRVDPGKNGINIRFSTHAHIPFHGNDGKPHWFPVFQAIHKAMNPDDPDYFVPSRRYTGCNPMAAFDPNLCSCLDWSVEPSEEEQSAAAGFKWLRSAQDCGKFRPDVELPDQYGGASFSEIDFDTDRCLEARHGVIVRTGSRTVLVEFLRCLDDDNMLVLRQTTSICVASPTDPEWEGLISPGSISQSDDTDMLGKTWCHSERCAVTTMNKRGCSLGHVECKINGAAVESDRWLPAMKKKMGRAEMGAKRMAMLAKTLWWTGEKYRAAAKRRPEPSDADSKCRCPGCDAWEV